MLPWLMTDSPAQAKWLSPHDRELLQQAREEDEPAQAESNNDHHGLDFGDVGHLLLFAAIYFAMQFGLYAQSFWLPRVLADLHVAKAAIGWHVSLVYVSAAVLMLVWGRVTDRAPTRRWTLAAPLLVAAFGYALTSLGAHRSVSPGTLTLVLIAFSLGSAGALAATPPFWAQVTLGQRTSAIAAMIALINALGNVGGFAGPAVLGRLYQSTGTYATGMICAAAAIALSVVLFLCAQTTSQLPPAQPTPPR